MTEPAISGIAPLFIVRNVTAALSFYHERLGFDITFQGPDPGDIFFGIVQRGRAMIMFKDVGVDPQPNCTRDVGQGLARWDAYLHVPDPDATGGRVLVAPGRVRRAAGGYRRWAAWIRSPGRGWLPVVLRPPACVVGNDLPAPAHPPPVSTI